MTVYRELYALLGQVSENPTARDVVDVLWLANQMVLRARAAQSTEDNNSRTDQSKSLGQPESSYKITSPKDTASSAQSTERAGPSELQYYKPIVSVHSASDLSLSTKDGSTGITLRIPANCALQNPRALAKALSPLRRRIPSCDRYELDEAGTAAHIADARGIRTLVLVPAQERWLEIALVIDESSTIYRRRTFVG